MLYLKKMELPEKELWRQSWGNKRQNSLWLRKNIYCWPITSKKFICSEYLHHPSFHLHFLRNMAKYSLIPFQKTELLLISTKWLQLNIMSNIRISQSKHMLLYYCSQTVILLINIVLKIQLFLNYNFIALIIITFGFHH